MRSHLLRAAALALLAFVACESPFEPQGLGERVPVGQVITDDVSSDTVLRYSFVSEAGGPYVVFLDALEGTVTMGVVDSTRQSFVAYMTAGPSTPALHENPSPTFLTRPGDIYQITATTLGSGNHARFQFLVYPINTSPELQSDRFALGDTVSGEPIDPQVDVDRFIMHGEAGQEFVAVAEALGPAGSGAVFLNVLDSVTPSFLGYVFAEAGTTNRLTTGRVRLPATHDYQFTLGSVSGNLYPRYRGPYRFWTYLINRAPEHRAAGLPSNTEIQSEAIERAGDVDEFTFQANVGDAFMAFLQSPLPVQAEMSLPNGPPLAIAACPASSDTGLFARVTNRLQVTQGGTYVLRVAGTNPSQVADTGRYRLFLYAIDQRPEHVSAVIPSGVAVVEEDLGRPGDVDEFTFSGVAGEQVDAFFQAQNGSPDDRLQLWVLDPGGVVQRSILSTGTDTSLYQQVTGRFALPSTGTYRLRVTGYDNYCGRGYRGAYQVFLHRVNSQPESVPDTLAFGDSLSGESIDLPGDYDEFRVTVPDSSGANLAFELEAPSPPYPGLVITLIDSTTGTVVATTSGGGRAATGRLSLAPGRYIVRVDASVPLDFSTVRGSYRLWFYRFGLGPESLPDTFAIGDTVSGEVIEPWGDADAFRFYGVRGQHVNIALQGRADTTGGGFEAWIYAPVGYAAVFSGASDPSLHDHQTRRLDILNDGWHRVEVSGFGSTRGAYRLLVEPVGTSPENAAAALVPGDSVTTESIDFPGDWDEFTVTASPGQELEVITSGAFPGTYVLDATTWDTLASQVGIGDRIVGPFRVPAGGQVVIAMFQQGGYFRFCYDATCGGAVPFVGPYRFHVQSLNRPPESVPGAFTVGDTVRGEAISPVGDIDEFTASGTPGDTLTPAYHLTADPVPSQGLITLEIVDPASGSVLVGSGAAVFAPFPQFFSPGSFTVPSGGAFIVRVRGYGSYGTGTATAPYEFVVKH